MTEFPMKLAGVPFAVRCLYPSTEQYCRDFRTDEEPEFTVTVSSADLASECGRRPGDAGTDPEPIRDPYLETLALYRKIVERLLAYGVLLVHGAGIAADGRGILFTAPSGTGKTTHIRLWQQFVAPRLADFAVINGDKPLLRLGEDGICMYGTPWQGKESMGENRAVRLDAVVALRRGQVNRIRIAERDRMLPVLLRQTYRPQGSEGTKQMLRLLDRLFDSVRFYELECTPEPEAADTAYRGIFGEVFPEHEPEMNE